jgi:hypothetical protein
MRVSLARILFLLVASQLFAQRADIEEFANAHRTDLNLNVYITAHEVSQNLDTEMGRREAMSLLRCNGIHKVLLECFRSGYSVKPELLTELKQFFEKQNIRVWAGIAPLPGEGSCVRQEARLEWLNWQNPKTQKDLTAVIKSVAAVFDTLVIDDFFCTGDTSLESKTAKGNLSWSQYRRDLLTGLASDLFLKQARSVNPDIKIIIKYPQWYDRFHLFGYDVPRESALFDGVWVGTETRGANTQRYGFVQPYEGFVNYRWIKSVAPKTTTAWFDHGDCDALDFIDQAYQSILAGAKELTIFSYHVIVNGHPGHHLLRREWDRLADLAAKVDVNAGPTVLAFKPTNTDAGGDLYLYDFIGMMGVPLQPVARWPEKAPAILLSTQASGSVTRQQIEKALLEQATIVMTAGFLNSCHDEKLLKMAGVSVPAFTHSLAGKRVRTDGVAYDLVEPLTLAADVQNLDATVLVDCEIGGKYTPFMTKKNWKNGRIIVLNSHTFSQKDFDAVDEVLLAPRKVGMLYVPEAVANKIREAIIADLHLAMTAPARITLQPVRNQEWFIQNYNSEPAKIRLQLPTPSGMAYRQVFNDSSVDSKDGFVYLTLPARGRSWLRAVAQ